jgi:multiple antibiotic resistance protein
LIETAGIALATFFATIGPIDVAAIFAALTASSDAARRRSMAIRGTLIGTAILLAFALVGEALLTGFGISLAALRTAGGILLLLIGIEMVFARSSGGTSTTDEEEREAATKEDISAFPIGMPLIAGPGAMSATILLMANAGNDLALKVVVIGSLLVILLATFVSMLLASRLQRALGVTGMHVISRIFGVLLCALAVQFVFDGIRQSGLLGGN